MPMPVKSLLVGSHFRPPAKQLLASLPSGTPCQLVPEPENPYDEHAIRVELPLSSLPDPNPLAIGIDHSLEGTGFTLADLLESDTPIHLGYIPQSINKQHLSMLQQGEQL